MMAIRMMGTWAGIGGTSNLARESMPGEDGSAWLSARNLDFN